MPKNIKTTSPKRQMPKFAPAPEAMVNLFGEALLDYPEAEQRKMFGYPAAFVNGQMFAGLFGEAMMIRLPEADRGKFIEVYKSKLFEPMPGRPMKEYVLVPRSMLKSRTSLKAWIGKAMAYAQSLPPTTKR